MSQLPARKPMSWSMVRDAGKAFVTFYRHGASVQHCTDAEGEPFGGAERGAIGDMSDSSRRRAAFAVGNASCEWVAMTVLTWGTGGGVAGGRGGPCQPFVYPQPCVVKDALQKLKKALHKRFGEGFDAWIMEFQKRGAPHFHLFHCRESVLGSLLAAANEAGHVETFTRPDGTERTVTRCGTERWIVNTWLRITEQEHDAAAVDFNEGGIIEPLRSPDAAGRYIAKECGKREQKLLPDAYQTGLGRWWYLSEKWRPVPVGYGYVSLNDGTWPFAKPLKLVWRKETLNAALCGRWDADSHLDVVAALNAAPTEAARAHDSAAQWQRAADAERQREQDAEWERHFGGWLSDAPPSSDPEADIEDFRVWTLFNVATQQSRLRLRNAYRPAMSVL